MHKFIINKSIMSKPLIQNFCENDYRFDKCLVDRINESFRVREEYPDRIPVICQRSNHSKLSILGKRKYLVPKDLSATQFLFIIRRRLNLPTEKGLFLFIGNVMASSSNTIQELYDLYKNEDGFLYMTYNEENVFG